MPHPNIIFLFSKLMTIREIRAVLTEVFSVIFHDRVKRAETSRDWKWIVVSSLLD